MIMDGKILEMCKNLRFSEGKLSDEYLFTLNVVDLFYYKKNMGQIDIKTGFTDGPNDGGIDFIYSDNETMYLVQGKSSENLSFDDIKNIFYKMAETVINFDDKNYYDYSQILRTAYINSYDDLNDDKNIELVLFTNTILDDKTKKKIAEFSQKEPINNYKITIYDEYDIKEKEAIIAQDSDLVNEDYIEIMLNPENKNDILSYGDNGIIVNVKASSVKHLYEKYSMRGLFSYNLREHIGQKSVDDAIDRTIKNEKDRFWFYNNGITIGCEHFFKDGNRIKLYGFSIINGAQTTTKIGKSKLIDEKNDFVLSCKVVKAENSVEKDGDFIGKISEASNSQKPIKQRDLKANAKEQKIMQYDSEQNGKYALAIEIKRGVKPPNYRKVEKWQCVTNEYIGQLIYACILQHPGPARNSKNSMFSSSKLYNQIFKRKHNYDTLYDLVRIGNTYDEFLLKFIENNDDVDIIAVAQNGKLTVIAILLYLYKKQKRIVKSFSSDQLYKDNVTGLLITDYPDDDLDKKLDNLFTFIIRKLRSIYETKKDSMKITSYSNFFKSEQIYELILKEFDNLDEWDKEKIKDFMVIFERKRVD